MKRLLVVLLVVLAGCTAKKPLAEPTWRTDYDAALAEAAQTKKLVMVDFYTDWCTWCKKLDADVYSDPTVRAKLAAGFVAVKLNPEKSPRAAELVQKFGGRGFPFVAFVDAKGNKVQEIGGYVPRDLFLRFLDELKP